MSATVQILIRIDHSCDDGVLVDWKLVSVDPTVYLPVSTVLCMHSVPPCPHPAIDWNIFRLPPDEPDSLECLE